MLGKVREYINAHQNKQNVTDQEIARTLGYILLTENSDIRKLFDYTAYLPIMEKAGKLIDQNNTEIINELRVSNI